VELWWQQFLLIFLRTNDQIYVRIQFLTGRRPVSSYSPGALTTIALWMEVGAYVQGKLSALACCLVTLVTLHNITCIPWLLCGCPINSITRLVCRLLSAFSRMGS